MILRFLCAFPPLQCYLEELRISGKILCANATCPFLHHFASHHFVFFFAPSLLRVFAFKFILVAALPRCGFAFKFILVVWLLEFEFSRMKVGIWNFPATVTCLQTCPHHLLPPSSSNPAKPIASSPAIPGFITAPSFA